jgi:aminopeptidase N
MRSTPPAAGHLDRGSALDIVAYDLALDLTRGPQTFGSRTEVRFRCGQPGAATFADLTAVRVQRATLNGESLDRASGGPDGRLELPRLAAENVLVVEAECAYAAAAGGLTYVTDPRDGSAYMYGKSSGGRAPRAYCCFDEPELRAPVTVSMQAPAGWTCLANAPLLSRPPDGDPGWWQFAPTPPIPPWLTSFCAGPFAGPTLSCERDEGRPLPVTIQAVPAAVAPLAAAPILELLRRPLRYYEHSLGVPYPDPKCDLVFVPSCPGLAYSVPGLIVILDEVLAGGQDAGAAGRDTGESRYRAAVIAHELAHAWVGGLVTLRPRAEAWLEEALTTYVSRTALAAIFPGTTPWAASTSVTLPDHAYAGDAAAIRQLDGLIGTAAVFGGLGALLRGQARGSVSRDDLVRSWSRASGRDLRDWAAATLVPGGPAARER